MIESVNELEVGANENENPNEDEPNSTNLKDENDDSTFINFSMKISFMIYTFNFWDYYIYFLLLLN